MLDSSTCLQERAGRCRNVPSCENALNVKCFIYLQLEKEHLHLYIWSQWSARPTEHLSMSAAPPVHPLLDPGRCPLAHPGHAGRGPAAGPGVVNQAKPHWCMHSSNTGYEDGACPRQRHQIKSILCCPRYGSLLAAGGGEVGPPARYSLTIGIRPHLKLKSGN